MKRTGIEWCEYVWNPVTGCQNRCPYCSSRKFTASFAGDVRKNRLSGKFTAGPGLYMLEAEFKDSTDKYIPYPFAFEPTLHKYRMTKGGGPGTLKVGYNIHVGSMGECFGEWVPDEWLRQIFQECEKYGQHNYIFMTKYPDRYEDAYEKEILNSGCNYWYGRTLTGGKAGRRMLANHIHTFINFEPLRGEIIFDKKEEKLADWFIIGGFKQSGTYIPLPDKEWINGILDYADEHDIPVFMNNSIMPVKGISLMRKELPPHLKQKKVERELSGKMAGTCVKCGSVKMKKEMIAVLTRSVRAEAPKQTAYICTGCFQDICREWNVPVPELEVYKV